MHISLYYKELSELVYGKIGHRLDFERVDDLTLRVSKKLDAIILTYTPKVDIHVDDVNSKLIKLSYSGGWGVKKIVSLALKFLAMQSQEISDAITFYEGNRLLVSLGKITQLKSALKTVSPQKITFSKDAIEVDLCFVDICK